MFEGDTVLAEFRTFLAEHRGEADARAFEALIAFIRETTGENLPFPYWYPLWKLKKPIPTAAYDLVAIYRDGAIAQLSAVLSDCGIVRADAFQLQITKNGLRLHTVTLPEKLEQQDAQGGYDFPWEVETFYYDSTKSWLLYVSHEGTITFAGEKFTEAAQRQLAEKYRYHG